MELLIALAFVALMYGIVYFSQEHTYELIDDNPLRDTNREAEWLNEHLP